MEFLKKNGFWIASFLLVATMIGVWFYSTGFVKKKTDERIGNISSAISKLDAVNRTQAEEGSNAHPNKSTEDGMNQKLATLTDSVIEAWEKRYDAQREILKWPDRILTAGFVNEFSRWSPPETLDIEEKGKSQRMQSLLLLYKQQIPSQMKSICSIIQTNWEFQDQLTAATKDSPKEDSTQGDDEGDQEQGEDKDEDAETDEEDAIREIVKWNPINQELWFDKLTSFSGRDDNEFPTAQSPPSPSQVLMLQQDLWLLEAMFDIIRTVNARMQDGKMVMGADDKPEMVQANDLAPVKEIDHVVFGREALALLGEITDTMGTSDTNAARGGGRGRGGRGGGGSSAASDAAFVYYGKPAYHGRYVNANLEPIPSETIQKVLSEKKQLPADNLELVIAKRVPVRLAVQMDEREIPKFLAACSNSPFAFEVWQVRINRHDSEEVIKLRGSEGASSGASGVGGSRGSIGGAATGGVGGGGGTAEGSGPELKIDTALRRDFNVGVEFYGIVKIYNPVNYELLGKADSDKETATP